MRLHQLLPRLLHHHVATPQSIVNSMLQRSDHGSLSVPLFIPNIPPLVGLDVYAVTFLVGVTLTVDSDAAISTSGTSWDSGNQVVFEGSGGATWNMTVNGGFTANFVRLKDLGNSGLNYNGTAAGMNAKRMAIPVNKPNSKTLFMEEIINMKKPHVRTNVVVNMALPAPSKV